MYSGKIPFPNLNGSTSQIDNAEFELTLKFFETLVPSKKNPSRKRHVLVDQQGTKFPMMPQEFDALVKAYPQIMTTFVKAAWEFTKRGNQYGLKLSPKMLGLNIDNTVTGRVNVAHPTTSNSPKMDLSLKETIGQVAATPQPKQRKTLFALCLDSSGSMSSIRRETTVAAVNNVLQSIRDAAKANNQIAEVMLMKFGTGPGDIETTFDLTPLDQVKDITVASYRPDRGTPLFECIGRAIDRLKKHPDAKDEEVSFFVHAITDGDENQSSAPYDVMTVNRMIAAEQATDRWTFAVQVPKGSEHHFSRSFNVPAGNVQGWELSERGIQYASQSTSNAMGQYMRGRSVGVRSVKNVYTTDLSAVKLDDVRSKLLDVSSSVKTKKVEKEAVIKEFAEEWTKKPYVIGSIWYCLTKKETVQHYKGIMIRVKNTKEFYAGPDVRRLIGIDPNDTKDATVVPGNHSNYDIYVQSTSTNRKLVRGTDIVLLPPLAPVPETWDSAAAKAAADAKKAQQQQQTP